MIIDIVNLKKEYPKAYELFSSSSPYSFFEFFDKQGFYIKIIPEFYKEGINWNMQVIWYRDPTDWPQKPTKNIEEYLTVGTGIYGDNNEFPTRKDAENAGVILAFELLERRLEGKKMIPDFFDTLRNHDELKFDKLFRGLNTE